MKISVIVPVYNVEHYLERCLTSLVQQTLPDVEIIAINDGSTDNSGAILQQYAEQYANITVVTQKNDGISAARNKGISMATGDYIAFIDSDDSVTLDFCEQLLTAAERHNADIAICDFYEVCGNEKATIHLPSFSPCTVYDTPSLLFDINSSPWNKLYKKTFLTQHHATFPLGLKYEDAPFIHHLLACGATLAKVDKPLVNYTIRAKSETTIVKKTVFDIFPILDSIITDYQSKPQADAIALYLEYFVVNRITAYNLQQVRQEDSPSAMRFIDDGFAYLNKHFPVWRNNPPFNAANSTIKRLVKKNKFITKAVVYALRLSKTRS